MKSAALPLLSENFSSTTNMEASLWLVVEFFPKRRAASRLRERAPTAECAERFDRVQAALGSPAGRQGRKPGIVHFDNLCKTAAGGAEIGRLPLEHPGHEQLNSAGIHVVAHVDLELHRLAVDA